MDPYVVLGVDRVAGPDEIEAAFARRSRLHHPDSQSTDAERAAAERYHAELADAYRALLGTAPHPATGDASARGMPQGRSGASLATDTAVRPPTRAPSPARGLLVVLGTLLGAYLVLQVSVTIAPGFGGLILGIVGALALVSFVLVREHNRS